MRILASLLACFTLAACTDSSRPSASDAGPAGSDASPEADGGSPPPPPPPSDAGSPPPRFPSLPTSCWLPPGSECHPATNEGCEADEACDISAPPGEPVRIVCYPPPATAELGEACDNDSGPFCQGGLRCMARICRDTCCTDADCGGSGERCVPLDERFGTLGTCSDEPPPSCAPPGGFCRQNADCCSRDCHFDHCH